MNSRETLINVLLEIFSKKNLAFKTGEEFVSILHHILTNSFAEIRQKLAQAVTRNGVIDEFEMSAFEITNELGKLNTADKVKSVASRLGHYADPNNFLVDKEVVFISGELQEKRSTGTMMPIKHQIKCFLEYPKVFENIIENQEKLKNENKYMNMVNGSMWKNIMQGYNTKNVIPINFYCDDFNPEGAVGAHSPDTMLTAYYYHFPTLPDFMTTKLENIFLAAIHKSNDVNDEAVLLHGVDPVLFALWNVFHPLEENGLEIEVNGRKEKVFLVMPQFYGDNKALNFHFGYSRGFTGHFSCRNCCIHKDRMVKLTKQLDDLMRNIQNYTECLAGNTLLEKKGVKYNSWLNRFKHFKVYENYSVDIMHDVFLGVFKADLKQVLNYYINVKRTFTLWQFNKTKREFDYGRNNSGDKTSDINSDHLKPKKNLHMNAKEVWTLVEHLPLMLMGLVKNFARCKVFTFVLTMKKVLTSITKKEYSEMQIREMEQLITSHHTMFQKLFNEDFTPKTHNMLHYATIIRLFGPLRNSMVFRFEAKHQQLKRYAQSCYSRVNLPFSICRKFCFEFAYLMSKTEDIFEKIKQADIFDDLHFDVPEYHGELKFAFSVRYKGTIYAIKDVITTKEKHFIIRGVAIGMDEIYLNCQEIDSIKIDRIDSYLVEGYKPIFEIIKASNLKARPVNIIIVNNLRYFIPRDQ